MSSRKVGDSSTLQVTIPGAAATATSDLRPGGDPHRTGRAKAAHTRQASGSRAGESPRRAGDDGTAAVSSATTAGPRNRDGGKAAATRLHRPRDAPVPVDERFHGAAHGVVLRRTHSERGGAAHAAATARRDTGGRDAAVHSKSSRDMLSYDEHGRELTGWSHRRPEVNKSASPHVVSPLQSKAGPRDVDASLLVSIGSDHEEAAGVLTEHHAEVSGAEGAVGGQRRDGSHTDSGQGLPTRLKKKKTFLRRRKARKGRGRRVAASEPQSPEGSTASFFVNMAGDTVDRCDVTATSAEKGNLPVVHTLRRRKKGRKKRKAEAATASEAQNGDSGGSRSATSPKNRALPTHLVGDGVDSVTALTSPVDSGSPGSHRESSGGFRGKVLSPTSRAGKARGPIRNGLFPSAADPKLAGSVAKARTAARREAHLASVNEARRIRGESRRATVTDNAAYLKELADSSRPAGGARSKAPVEREKVVFVTPVDHISRQRDSGVAYVSRLTDHRRSPPLPTPQQAISHASASLAVPAQKAAVRVGHLWEEPQDSARGSPVDSTGSSISAGRASRVAVRPARMGYHRSPVVSIVTVQPESPERGAAASRPCHEGPSTTHATETPFHAEARKMHPAAAQRTDAAAADAGRGDGPATNGTPTTAGSLGRTVVVGNAIRAGMDAVPPTTPGATATNDAIGTLQEKVVASPPRSPTHLDRGWEQPSFTGWSDDDDDNTNAGFLGSAADFGRGECEIESSGDDAAVAGLPRATSTRRKPQAVQPAPIVADSGSRVKGDRPSDDARASGAAAEATVTSMPDSGVGSTSAGSNEQQNDAPKPKDPMVVVAQQDDWSSATESSEASVGHGAGSPGLASARAPPQFAAAASPRPRCALEGCTTPAFLVQANGYCVYCNSDERVQVGLPAGGGLLVRPSSAGSRTTRSRSPMALESPVAKWPPSTRSQRRFTTSTLDLEASDLTSVVFNDGNTRREATAGRPMPAVTPHRSSVRTENETNGPSALRVLLGATSRTRVHSVDELQPAEEHGAAVHESQPPPARCRTEGCASPAYLLQGNGLCTWCNRERRESRDSSSDEDAVVPAPST